ncbi:MAG: ArsA family ATPase [Xanthomonadaceae bacterium]|nr:ArsA family ATPase [Xanthomonadaceae bacterium]
MNKIDTLLMTNKVLITCGTGGVGKTTLSCALGVRAAELGRKTIVITIDPAKRLATALGLDSLTHDATEIALKDVPGKLFALMPDTQRSFEEFFDAISPTSQISEKIKSNPIFQILGQEFSGAHEYMALQKLSKVYNSGEYDLIILDTPPNRQALAFFEAPRLLKKFFDEKWIRHLIVPSSRLAAGSIRKALEMLEKLTGVGFITHLISFAASVFETEKKFTERLEQVIHVLESKETGFIFVATAKPELAYEMNHFISELERRGYRFNGLIFNRSLSKLAVSQDLPASAALIIQQWIKKEELTLSRLSSESIAIIPECSRDIHSIGDLTHVARLFVH